MADINVMGIGCVASIVVICYLVATIVKTIPQLENKFIPCICGIVGGILGVVGMYIIPEYPATDYMNAIAYGVVSGLAATGCYELITQLVSRKPESEDNDVA